MHVDRAPLPPAQDLTGDQFDSFFTAPNSGASPHAAPTASDLIPITNIRDGQPIDQSASHSSVRLGSASTSIISGTGTGTIGSAASGAVSKVRGRAISIFLSSVARPRHHILPLTETSLASLSKRPAQAYALPGPFHALGSPSTTSRTGVETGIGTEIGTGAGAGAGAASAPISSTIAPSDTGTVISHNNLSESDQGDDYSDNYSTRSSIDLPDHSGSENAPAASPPKKMTAYEQAQYNKMLPAPSASFSTAGFGGSKRKLTKEEPAQQAANQREEDAMIDELLHPEQFAQKRIKTTGQTLLTQNQFLSRIKAKRIELKTHLESNNPNLQKKLRGFSREQLIKDKLAAIKIEQAQAQGTYNQPARAKIAAKRTPLLDQAKRPALRTDSSLSSPTKALSRPKTSGKTFGKKPEKHVMFSVGTKPHDGGPKSLKKK